MVDKLGEEVVNVKLMFILSKILSLDKGPSLVKKSLEEAVNDKLMFISSIF